MGEFNTAVKWGCGISIGLTLASVLVLGVIILGGVTCAGATCAGCGGIIGAANQPSVPIGAVKTTVDTEITTTSGRVLAEVPAGEVLDYYGFVGGFQVRHQGERGTIPIEDAEVFRESATPAAGE